MINQNEKLVNPFTITITCKLYIYKDNLNILGGE